MKITSWNVNSVRARIENIINYIKSTKPDILMIQEIKTEEKSFPSLVFKELGYESYVFGQKSYNGVAFISKIHLNKININFFKDENKQSRIIVGDIKRKKKDIKIINIYAPNGNPVDTDKYIYKKNWFNLFIKNLKKNLIKNQNVIIGGDFNIIPERIDVYDFNRYKDDALFKLEIRKRFYEITNLGFHDVYRHLYQDKQEYTFWDYMSGAWQKNNGMRIDHFLVSTNLLGHVKNLRIDKNQRGKSKPSDHVPIELEIN